MLEALTGKLEGGRPVVSVTVGARAPESDVADLLRETEAAHPGVAIGSYPFFKDGRYGANFVIRSDDGELARRTGDELVAAAARGGLRAGRRRDLPALGSAHLAAGRAPLTAAPGPSAANGAGSRS